MNNTTDYISKYEALASEIEVGEDKWNAIRKAWTTPRTNTTPTTDTKKKYYTVDVDSIVEHLVNPKKPAFKHPVPLPEMVNILIELWEEDGLFD